MDSGGLLWQFPSALMAWRNLGRSRVRTGLATLGIVIGVIAISSLGIAGVALHHQATSNLGSLTNEVMVSSGEDSTTYGITDNQIAEIQTTIDNGEVVPQKSDWARLSARGGQEVTVSVTATTKAGAMYELSNGDAPDRLRSGALISTETAAQLGLEVGDPVTYNGNLYRIQGLIESEQGFGSRRGNKLVVPLSARSDQQHYDSVTIVAANGEEAQAIAATLDAEFNDPESEEMRITSYGDAKEEIDSFMDTLNLALLGIGSISLIVASVAILNVMLMSTIERRGEIGVLRAVGIRRGEVLRMILTEAAFIGVLGGLLGAAGSLAVGMLLFHFIADDMMLVFGWRSYKYLLYGFGFAVVASLLSGLYPAWKAANDPPVEALRG